MVETDVHYPTDINLLCDAMRKVITLTARVCEDKGIAGWRQSAHTVKKVKKLYRRAQQVKRSKANSPRRARIREKEIRKAHKRYIDESRKLCAKARLTIEPLVNSRDIRTLASISMIEKYLGHADRQIDQLRRRVLNGERIPHEEKVFSIFEPHTEWISKGKAGVPQELGMKVCIVEDRCRFILNHRVMKKTSDVEVAVPLIEETIRKFPELTMCSFDKGFHSPANKRELEKMLDTVVLPKKGKRSESRRNEESEKHVIVARKNHSGVESAISALENHGLDRCPDNGLSGFERYVALAVVARNIQVLGTILWKQDVQRIKRDRSSRKKTQPDRWYRRERAHGRAVSIHDNLI